MIRTNLFWLFFDKFIRVILALFVGAWVARYLGPDSFGKINYSLALIAILGPLISLGFNEIVVKELVTKYHMKHTILGSVFLAQLFAALISVSLIVGSTFYTSDDNQNCITYLVILSVPFSTSAAVKYFMESKVLSYRSSLVELIVLVFMAVLKIIAIKLRLEMVYFVLLTLAEVVLSSLALFYYYHRSFNDLFSWRADFVYIKYLIRLSYPLILSGFAVSVYMRMDQILIANFIGSSELGLFTSALRLSEITYTVPIFFMSTIFPKIISLRDENPDKFIMYFEDVIKILVLVSLIIVAVMSVLSDFIIFRLFGSEFERSSIVLKIHIWSTIFVFIGVAGSKWYLIENLQKYLVFQTLLGALVNLILNFLWLRRYGIVGAAYATLVSQIISSFFFDIFFVKTRFLFFLKARALLSSVPWGMNKLFFRLINS